MKDKESLKWILAKSKRFIPYIVLLCIVNIVYACMSVLSAVVSKLIIDAATNRNFHGICIFGIVLFAVITGRALMHVASSSMEVTIQAKLEMHMKSQLFRDIMNKDFEEINRYHSGELMNRLTSDISIISNGITTIVPNAAYLIAQFTGAFFVLVVFDWKFALVFIVGGIIVLFTTAFFRTRLKNLHKDVQASDGNVRSFLQEAIESLIVVKTFSVEEEFDDKSDILQKINYNAKMLRRRVTIFANTSFSFVFNLGYLFALLWCSFKLYNRLITYGTLTAVIQLISQVQTPFANITKLIPQFYGVVASAERIIEIEDIKGEKAINPPDMDINKLYEDMKSISFENISFGYDRDIVLENARLEINKGDFVAIRGISGIGKSTLLKLLLGVFHPQGGSIKICCSDGRKIETDKVTRDLFSYVPQGNYLLSGTIRENLLIVNREASEEEIEEALNISYANHFIKKLPKGLETVIGEKGLGLSEGQVQRLAIARAILSKSPIILLDEATSALDGKTEKYVLEHIKAMNNKTCIIITHRQAALEVCNKEVVIDNHKIVCVGASHRTE